VPMLPGPMMAQGILVMKAPRGSASAFMACAQMMIVLVWPRA
jgi:hypothetical protein